VTTGGGDQNSGDRECMGGTEKSGTEGLNGFVTSVCQCHDTERSKQVNSIKQSFIEQRHGVEQQMRLASMNWRIRTG